ncbi:hypothetical protein HU200_053230 [Digitaria exilis]|uniref:Non-haem dioxygenase N-terminal domain-containing protein n=1 Tax=Digitaria exilis TaxID=1010633 RepID=A0A835AJW3_9POAL|nr:hypothetical protein HU200_053230 [Digitaria exilis]
MPMPMPGVVALARVPADLSDWPRQPIPLRSGHAAAAGAARRVGASAPTVPAAVAAPVGFATGEQAPTRRWALATRTPASPAQRTSILSVQILLRDRPTMVVLTKGELEQITLIPSAQRASSPPPLAVVPEVDLSTAIDGTAAGRAVAARAVARACEEHGFFKVTGHGVPARLLARLDAAAAAFFALPQQEKEKAAGSPFGYASKRIGGNGDLGWVEYLLLGVTAAGAAAPPLPCCSFR